MMVIRGLSLAEQLSRYPVALPFAYRNPGSDTIPRGRGRTRDLSESGAWVELPEALDVATDLEVQFRAGQEIPWFPARVAWSRPDRSSHGVYLHGLTFSRWTVMQQRFMKALLSRGRPPDARRCYCGLPIICQRRDGATRTLRGRTRDVSEGGVAVQLPEALPLGAPLDVRMETAYGTITATARVVWAEGPTPRDPGAMIRHGLRFVHLGMASSLPLSVLLAGLR